MTSGIHPIRYRIDILPDLNTFSFKGAINITCRTDNPVEQIVLNAQELTINTCELRQTDKTPAKCAFVLNAEKETLTIDLPEKQTGDFTLFIDYAGIINDAMAGFYRSQFQKEGQTHYLAVTQFQESSARSAFPCMDHPLYKAVFELTMTVPTDLTVLANTLPLREEAAADKHKRVTFEPSPVMSTYLVFFGYGAFDIVQDTLDPRVRVAHLPGLGHTTDLGLAFGRQALQFCEDYYGIAYPLKKMDLIAVPDFAFGAMENWGAITFRENLLLRFPELTSKAGSQRICEIIAHEIAHQWFGNLVTPSDWKYLWLNESFATYFGYGVVQHYYPEWHIWDQFLNNETATALTRDGLIETFAIEIPGGEHVVINSSTAPIIYNKGGSILRMIEGYIGPELYRQGVQAYLNRHQYACAESKDLWQAFEQASDRPITAMMQSWINQPGHPVLHVQRDANALAVRQKRFTYLANDNQQTWLIPMTLTAWDADGRPQGQVHLLDGADAAINLPENTVAYKLNTGQTGFFRTAYADRNNLKALGALIADQKMPAVDRWGIQDDMYALVRQTSLPLSDYLNFLGHYTHERDYLPLTSMADHLFQALLIAPQSHRAKIAGFGRKLAENVLDHMGYAPAQGEPQTTSLLRDQLLWQAVLWRSDTAKVFGEEHFNRMTTGEKVHPDIAKSTLQTGAFCGGEKTFNWLCERLTQSTSEHERMNILIALSAFQDWELMEKALAYALEKVPPRNRFIPIVAAAANPANQEHLWGWYKNNLQRLEQLHPLLFERTITGLWPYAGISFQDDVQRFGHEYIKAKPALTDAVKLALENLAINCRMRAHIASKA